LQIQHKFFIGLQDVGINNEMTNKAFFEAFTNIANIHRNSVIQDKKAQENSHLSWMVLNWKLEVYQRPKTCETILVKTWVQGYSGIRAYRDFEVFNQKNETIAKATSMWIAVNTKSGKPTKMTDDLMGMYEFEPQHKNFPDYKFPKTMPTNLPIVSEIRFKINKSMIDRNHHVHNPSYMDLVNEVLPEGVNENNFNNIEVNYKKEIKLHEEVFVEYATDDKKSYVYIWDKSKDTLHATVVMY